MLLSKQNLMPLLTSLASDVDVFVPTTIDGVKKFARLADGVEPAHVDSLHAHACQQVLDVAEGEAPLRRAPLEDSGAVLEHAVLDA